MTRVASKTVVKRTRDEALEHVKTTLCEGGNPLTKQEVSFIRTSCHILGIESGNMVKAIVKGAKEKTEEAAKKSAGALAVSAEGAG
jgi:hypothetical protein